MESEPFQRLRRQIRSRLGVVPFIGAGLSIPRGLPGWSSFLEAAAERVSLVDDVRALAGRGEMEEAAELLEDAYSPEAWSALLHETYGREASPVGAVLRTPLLANGPVVTTNFDRVLESVFLQHGTPFDEIVSGASAAAVQTALHEDRPYLLKLHGDAMDPNRRILTYREYRRHYESGVDGSRPQLPQLLEQIFTSRTLLFLGCSLHYDRTLDLLRRVRTSHGAPPQHYAVLEYPAKITDLAARVAELSALHILPIWYPYGQHDVLGLLLDILLELEEVRRPSAQQPALRPEQDAPLVAIDFGTWSSLLGFVPRPNHVQIIPNSSGRLTNRSVVHFTSEWTYEIGDMVVGSTVVKSVRNVKRLLGNDTVIPLGRRRLSPEAIVSMIVRSLLRNAEDYFGVAPTRALLSIPANFSLRQGNALVAACEAAGVTVMRTIGEPCAAALNIDSERDHSALVVDLGGGTLDVSLVAIGEGTVEVVAVAGDTSLGGIEFDEVVRDMALQFASSSCGHALIDREDLLAEAERAKILLSSGRDAIIIIRDVQQQDGNTVDHVSVLRPDTFVERSQPLVRRFEAVINQVLSDQAREFAERSGGPLDTVMLAGLGGSVSPIRQYIERRFGDCQIVTEFQANAVVRGLTTYAGVLEGKNRSLLLLDTLYRAIAVRCSAKLPARRHSRDWPGVNSTTDFTFDRMNRREAGVLRDGDHRNELVALHDKSVIVPSFTLTHLILEGRSRQRLELDVVEISNTSEESMFSVGRASVDLSGDRDILIALDTDANRTAVLHVIDVGARRTHLFQINNFYTKAAPSDQLVEVMGVHHEPLTRIAVSHSA